MRKWHARGKRFRGVKKGKLGKYCLPVRVDDAVRRNCKQREREKTWVNTHV